eukprot:TRINITY_DN21919_c0_g1_i1.p1 TRINITY_DN21919_c0_g1~~TRINITY_DN21919_c0_g1_i1.p1  ORF type:complete len:400 (+),score=72.98 TRINITY_DN21919_c0_g1_i1:77-1276(+)
MSVFQRNPLEKDREMYGVLTDPTALASDGDQALNGDDKDERGARRGIRRRCAMGSMCLAFMYFTTYSMFNDAQCTHGTSSGVPFRLVTQMPGRYGCSMLLATLATFTALFYPIAVARKPRPHFLHVAGSYLMVNAFTMCNEVATVWAGCARVEWIRGPSALFALVGLAVCFILMQYSILVKVEALDVESREEELSKAPLRRAYHMMLNPFTIGFGLLSSVVPLGLVDEKGFIYLLIVFVQAFFIIIFLGVMVSFTAISVKQMRACLTDLDNAQLDRVKKNRLRNHLAMHSVATLVANMASMLFLGSVAGVVLSVVSERFMFIMYGLDVAANTTCALTLSGLTGAVCRKGGGVALLEGDVTGISPDGPQGPVQQLEAAGHARHGDDEERFALGDQTEEAE